MSRRTKKVESVLIGELSTLLLTKISDPALQNISLSDVETAADLKEAKVYFTVRDEAELTPKRLKEIRKGFERAIPFLKRELGRALDLRNIPNLEFIHDEHLNELTRVIHLLDEVKKAPEERTNP